MNFKFFIVCLFFSTLSQAQLAIKSIDTLSVKASRFLAKDVYDNYYFEKNNTFIKKTSQETITYTNVNLGKLTTVDISNPLKIVVFYAGFNTVVLLDNQLNEMLQINGNLFDVNFEFISLARENTLWFFDDISQRIGLLYLEKNKVQFITNPLKNKPLYFSASYNYCFWIADNYLYKCSFSGKISYLEKVPTFEKLHLKNDGSYLFLQDNELYYSAIKDKEIKIKEKTLYNFDINNRILSIFTGNFLINYKIEQP